MSAPNATQATSPNSPTHGVWKGIGIGLAAGIVLTLGVSHMTRNYWPTRASGEGRNRADSVGALVGGEIVIPAASCDVSQMLAGIHDASDPVRFRVTLLRVVDGDTIRVLWHGEDTSVRLFGIDAPERNQPGAKEATNHLRDLLAGTDTVDLEFPAKLPRRDSLGRLLATVWCGDSNINHAMLKSGHATTYRRRR